MPRSRRDRNDRDDRDDRGFVPLQYQFEEPGKAGIATTFWFLVVLGTVLGVGYFGNPVHNKVYGDIHRDMKGTESVTSPAKKPVQHGTY